jgi:hypothetical protein
MYATGSHARIWLIRMASAIRAEPTLNRAESAIGAPYRDGNDKLTIAEPNSGIQASA